MAAYDLEALKNLFMVALEKSLRPSPSGRLSAALRYALLGEGKRLRPLLVLASALSSAKNENAETALKRAMPAALAVEYIHTYSLIHDDLPAMDDDDYRRGRLSVHRRFDEALAILAGDALQSDAFYVLANAPLQPALQCAELALAAGRDGLVAGQAEDLAASALDNSRASWLLIHQKKTARLFEASVLLGALSQGTSRAELDIYRSFGHHFGMAFQLKDDIDDNAGVFLQQGGPATAKLLRNHLELASSSAQALDHEGYFSALLRKTFDV